MTLTSKCNNSNMQMWLLVNMSKQNLNSVIFNKFLSFIDFMHFSWHSKKRSLPLLLLPLWTSTLVHLHKFSIQGGWLLLWCGEAIVFIFFIHVILTKNQIIIRSSSGNNNNSISVANAAAMECQLQLLTGVALPASLHVSATASGAPNASATMYAYACHRQ